MNTLQNVLWTFRYSTQSEYKANGLIYMVWYSDDIASPGPQMKIFTFYSRTSLYLDALYNEKKVPKTATENATSSHEHLYATVTAVLSMWNITWDLLANARNTAKNKASP